jgi:hypothetical protein
MVTGTAVLGFGVAGADAGFCPNVIVAKARAARAAKADCPIKGSKRTMNPPVNDPKTLKS